LEDSNYLKHIAYDSVVFGFSNGKLKILLMEYHNTEFYALPGGFVKENENLNDAVRRGLQERTGLENIYLEQFYTFGSLARHQPDVMETIMAANEQLRGQFDWLLDRYISVAYYALINYENVVPKPDTLADSCEWYALDKLPKLMLDHEEIVSKGLQTLRNNLEHKLVGVNLLPTYFTMSELQQVYEAILGEKLHRGAFQRKILNQNILQRHEKQFTGKAHKAPFLYSFKS
jgi:ADP-ribose pyrophosphatase YjhB (NUDIX family)